MRAASAEPCRQPTEDAEHAQRGGEPPRLRQAARRRRAPPGHDRPDAAIVHARHGVQAVLLVPQPEAAGLAGRSVRAFLPAAGREPGQGRPDQVVALDHGDVHPRRARDERSDDLLEPAAHQRHGDRAGRRAVGIGRQDGRDPEDVHLVVHARDDGAPPERRGQAQVGEGQAGRGADDGLPLGVEHEDQVGDPLAEERVRRRAPEERRHGRRRVQHGQHRLIVGDRIGLRGELLLGLVDGAADRADALVEGGVAIGVEPGQAHVEHGRSEQEADGRRDPERDEERSPREVTGDPPERQARRRHRRLRPPLGRKSLAIRSGRPSGHFSEHCRPIRLDMHALSPSRPPVRPGALPCPAARWVCASAGRGRLVRRAGPRHRPAPAPSEPTARDRPASRGGCRGGRPRGR